MVERSLIIADGDVLTPDSLPLNIQQPNAAANDAYAGFDLSGVEKCIYRKS